MHCSLDAVGIQSVVMKKNKQQQKNRKEKKKTVNYSTFPNSELWIGGIIQAGRTQIVILSKLLLKAFPFPATDALASPQLPPL